ncbi:hypothetical protein CONPUDRAFT_139208 [Coniophora puteana RWD-64-598 SS2]|uniref:phosphatidylinositol-3,4,5-trisphosphate 3-phosphatase n=1 Tax=Coniophora puteana (strain RWD-64-598) TaxID=741705 RepID=A0A5M3MDT9_CONPW|nr:uncharacterized protein CONPUDRAFT_139208 [Coniophora puteana RWD-64-598 SS2]EIW77207.1 hypothetical protein CONPUDRAFT_139208 [Coniophora puteana RWD-64-598 SS2]
MTDVIRRFVSGNKARFKDKHLHLELDLVYVTDQVIVMGYPAIGLEGLYRNRRDDAKKFLEHRHGKNYWVFNFCPVRENSYAPTVFDGRVSRYPFPDHHAPPLAVLPLVAREMRAWLDGSPDRVAVLHCKAGKGRSGTLACSYLLSMDITPHPPRLERSNTTKQWAQVKVEKLMQVMPTDDPSGSQPASPRVSVETLSSAEDLTSPAETVPSTSTVTIHGEEHPNGTIDVAPVSLKHVLDLHTSRRMKSPSSPTKKVKQGVSIPSQRRWLGYWSQLLANQGPHGFWEVDTIKPKPKVRLTEIKVRMKDLGGVRVSLVRAANMVIDRTKYGRSGGSKGNEQGHVWVSLARYDDVLAEELEACERATRHESGNMGKVRTALNEDGERETSRHFFTDSQWDSTKMVRSFARMGVIGNNAVQTEKAGDEFLTKYVLRPLSDERWVTIKEDIPHATNGDSGVVNDAVPSETNSIADVTHPSHERGIVVDAHREIRVKFYMGQVFIAWLWLIPAFHVDLPAMTPGTASTILLTRKDTDFPVGIGSALLDVEISFERCAEEEPEQPPGFSHPHSVTTPAGEAEGYADEPTGIAANVDSIATDVVGGFVETTQATAN